MKTVQEIIDYINDKTKVEPEFLTAEDPSDFYCGNEDDARELGETIGEYLALVELENWIKS
jgi:hypothetical protein